MTLSIDTNILVYANQIDDQTRYQQSIKIMDRVIDLRMPLSLQIFSEFLSVTHKKNMDFLDKARDLIRLCHFSCPTIEPDMDDRLDASHLAEAHKIQFYDAQLITTLAHAGVSILLSEDLKDGECYGAVTVLNPFNAHNFDRIEEAFAA